MSSSYFGPGYQNRYNSGIGAPTNYGIQSGDPAQNNGPSGRGAYSSTPFNDWGGYHSSQNGGPQLIQPVGGFGGIPTGPKPVNPQDFLGQYQLPSRYPDVTTTTGNTLGNVASVDKSIGIPHFDDLKNQFSSAAGDVNNQYNRYQGGNDISGFAAGQRAADANAAALTGQYAGTAHGILGQAQAIGDRYRTEGQGALDKVLGNAQDFYNKDIPASIADAQARASQYLKRFSQQQEGGINSANIRLAGQSAVQAALPFQREGRGFIDSALRLQQPFYGDVASRDYNRVAGLNLPTEGNIYGAQVGDVLRGKSTGQQIQSLDMLVRERGLNAAVDNLKRQGLPQTLINDLVGQWQKLKGGNLGIAGQAAGLEQQYGAEHGYYDRYGAPVVQPQYPGLPRPGFPNPNPGNYSGNTSGAAPQGQPQPSFDRYGNPTNLPPWVTDQRALSSQPGSYANSSNPTSPNQQAMYDLYNYGGYSSTPEHPIY